MGALVGAPLSSPKFPPATTAGPNWEGMALDSEGNYYLVGSHSGTARRGRHPTFAEPSADEPIRQPAFSEINPNQLIRAFDSRRHEPSEPDLRS
jgi:hypothetical protein